MKPFYIYIVSVDDRDFDTHTEVFTIEDEAIAFFMTACAINNLDIKKRNFLKNADYATIMVGSRRNFGITFSMYTIK